MAVIQKESYFSLLALSGGGVGGGVGLKDSETKLKDDVRETKGALVVSL